MKLAFKVVFLSNSPGVIHIEKLFMIFAKIKTFEIVTENHDNLTKFLTGNYYNLVEAEKRRTEAVRAGINDAFIAVYYNGQRVSILRKM